MSTVYTGPTPADLPHLPEALTAHHYAMLAQESGISDAVITARGYRTSTGYSELKSLGIALPSRVEASGLLLPVHKVDGKPATWLDVKADRTVPLVQYRLVQPWVDEEGRERKYLYPKGVSMCLDCSPLCQPHLDDPHVPLWITEGLKKEDALVSHGLVALGLFGVWNFRGTNGKGGKTVLPDWQYVHLDNREARVVFDSDVQEKAGVAAALDAIVSFLTFKRARVHVAYLPSRDGTKVGVDDYLLEHSLTDLEGLLVAPGRRTAPAHTAHRNGQAPTLDTEAWAAPLLLNKAGYPTETVSNIARILEHHPTWKGRFWFDTVRLQPMLDTEPVDDGTIAGIGRWLGDTLQMSVRSLRLVERCVLSLCADNQRDLLREWLEQLPPWDRVERLPCWLSEVAETPQDAYGLDVSRLIPLSMVARALAPGCQYRYVVILEGDEDSGKSKLVRALASPEWYVELSMGLESKEAHMMLQGAWVAELGELESLSRTEETRLKAFLTLEADVWIPKYSNFKRSSPRRTIFLGTTNEHIYLKGQTGNTRFLPIRTGQIDIPTLEAMREQLFAEALGYYRAHPQDWWRLSPDAVSAALLEREQRREINVYEDALGEWLETGRGESTQNREGKLYAFQPGETSWPEIAEFFLKRPDPADWKDKGMQMQIGKALRALGWEREVVKDEGRQSQKLWKKHR